MAAVKVRRLPKLRPINVSWRRQVEDHEGVRTALTCENERRCKAGIPTKAIPDLPERNIGSLQSIQTFRPVTAWSDIHPDDHHLYTPEQLHEPTGEVSRVKVINRLAYRHFDAVEGGEHQALVGFQTEAQERADAEYKKKRKAQADKLARRAKAAGLKVATDLVQVDPSEAKKAAAQAEKYANMHREAKQEIADRYEYGFYTKTCKVAGEVVAAFNEYLGKDCKNLRSGLGSPSVARMVALYPRKGLIRAGYDKGALFESATKLFALDAPYVELNKKIIGCIVVELDSVLRPEEFREALLAILGPQRMPNLIVGRISSSGFLVRPHLIWILKKPIWNDPLREITDANTGEVTTIGDKRCRMKPIKKAYVVQRCLTQLLLPLGADPAMTNMWKPKCPLSAFWSTIITNDDRFHALDDFEQIPNWPRNVDEAGMAETAATMRAQAAGATASGSNLAWRLVGNEIEPLARLQLKARDQDFIEAGKAGVESLARWFDAKVRPAVEAEIGPSEGLDRIMERRCTFHARWCLGKLSPRKRKSSRGRDRDIIFKDNPNPTPTDHRIEAGKKSAKHRRAVSVWALGKEAAVALSATGEIHRAAFIKNLDTVTRPTAYRCFDKVMAMLGLVEVEEGVFRKPTAVSPSVSDGAPKIKSQSHEARKQATVPGPNAPSTSDSTPAPSRSPGNPAQPLDPAPANPASGPPPWQTCALLPVDVRPQAVTRVPEPEPA
ncbi:hypothetical protein WHZ77_05870 [Bradyrhizobium sp. A5]|uniref:hypothetical protein n=1 Tax=Bradyrhizobium sp. A5 TaxID=3133696 RepID=UPI0032527B2C